MRRTCAAAALVVIVGLLLMPLSSGDAGAQELIDDETVESVQQIVPQDFPGAYDLPAASAEFTLLAGLIDQAPRVDSSGDGSQLTGVCGGWAYSYDRDGSLIDAAIDLGTDAPAIDLLEGSQAFTASNRFKVDPRGVIVYYGFSPELGDGPVNHRWYVKTSGFDYDRGGGPNDGLKNRNTGIVDLGQDLPLKFTANITIEGDLTSQNQPTCFAAGHVAVEGNGLTDPVGIAGLVLVGGGLVGLLFDARPTYSYSS